MPLRSSLALAFALVAACTSPPQVPRADASADARDVHVDALPNLTAIIRFPLLQERVFSPMACEVTEGCTLPGRRRLLRFDLSTPNLGPGDLAIGAPTVDGVAREGFEYAMCHGHWHLRGYADYRLLAMDGRELGRGHKQSFCLEDTDRITSAGPPLPDSERFTCARQGIHAGWLDVYLRGLDCQYVDVTDVPPGSYRLRATVNAESRITESRYDDNVAEITVTIPAAQTDAGDEDAAVDARVVDPTEPCAMGDQGVHRACGWEAEATARGCAPGARVTVGCDPGCDAPLGACAGDPVMRVCAGERVCDDNHALATGDDSCELDGGRNPCARVSFVCPAEGSYRVLTGAFRSGSAYTCRVAGR